MGWRRVRVLAAACAALFCATPVDTASAQADMVRAGSDLDLTLPEYMEKAGPKAKIVAVGELKIDGHTMVCGRNPTVIDNSFDSWGGAYPGFVILNTKRLEGLPTPVKLFVYAHECGHQWSHIGRNEEAADCFGIKRGRRYGWLDEEGLAQVCHFISKLKGDADHASGPERCEKMRACYREAAPRTTRSERR